MIGCSRRSLSDAAESLRRPSSWPRPWYPRKNDGKLALADDIKVTTQHAIAAVVPTVEDHEDDRIPQAVSNEVADREPRAAPAWAPRQLRLSGVRWRRRGYAREEYASARGRPASRTGACCIVAASQAPCPVGVDSPRAAGRPKISWGRQLGGESTTIWGVRVWEAGTNGASATAHGGTRSPSVLMQWSARGKWIQCNCLRPGHGGP
jgi:hypothetical protein